MLASVPSSKAVPLFVDLMTLLGDHFATWHIFGFLDVILQKLLQ